MPIRRINHPPAEALKCLLVLFSQQEDLASTVGDTECDFAHWDELTHPRGLSAGRSSPESAGGPTAISPTSSLPSAG